MGFMDTFLGGSALRGNSFDLPSSYAYVVLVGIGSIFLALWQGIQVGKMRSKFKIQYPTMYSTDNDLFNCYQRVHQNTVENLPQFLFMLTMGGLEMPVFSAIAGVIWIVGRVSYSFGYYTGNPEKRLQGGYFAIGLLMLLGASY